MVAPRAANGTGSTSSSEPQRRSSQVALLCGLALALSVLVGAAQMLPAWLYLPHSVRKFGISLQDAQLFSTHPLRLLGVVARHPWAGPLDPVYWGAS